MAVRISGYRLRFDTEAGTGDIVLYLTETDQSPRTHILRGLASDRFTALALLLTTDKDHRLLWDGRTVDAGPEEA